MGTVTAAYRLAVLAVFLFVRTCPARHTHLAATFLMLAWFAYNMMRGLLFGPDLVVALGVLDFAGAIFAFALYLNRPAWWKPLLGFLFLCQSATHAMFLSVSPDGDPGWAYTVALNLLFIGELAVVAAPAALFQLQRMRSRRVGRLTKA